MLKGDFHMHSSEDYYDSWISYSAKDLIREAAKQKFDVLSITHHSRIFFNKEIKDYAKKKGILLIPGTEARISGKDNVIINIDSHKKLARLTDLDKLHDFRKNNNVVTIAPHPFSRIGPSLNEELEPRIKHYDAIEYCHFYPRNPLKTLFEPIVGNKKVQALAEKYNKPMVGTSDCHTLEEVGTTYTMLDCNKNVDSVLEAIRKGKVILKTRHMPTRHFFKRGISAALGEPFSKKNSNEKRGPMPSIHNDPFFKRFI